jgi:hypothetical protein
VYVQNQFHPQIQTQLDEKLVDIIVKMETMMTDYQSMNIMQLDPSSSLGLVENRDIFAKSVNELLNAIRDLVVWSVRVE